MTNYNNIVKCKKDKIPSKSTNSNRPHRGFKWNLHVKPSIAVLCSENYACPQDEVGAVMGDPASPSLYTSLHVLGVVGESDSTSCCLQVQFTSWVWWGNQSPSHFKYGPLPGCGGRIRPPFSLKVLVYLLVQCDEAQKGEELKHRSCHAHHHHLCPVGIHNTVPYDHNTVQYRQYKGWIVKGFTIQCASHDKASNQLQGIDESQTTNAMQ